MQISDAWGLSCPRSKSQVCVGILHCVCVLRGAWEGQDECARGGGIRTAYVLHAYRGCVCMSGLFIQWVLGICLCTCIGRCLEYAGAPGGQFGYLDKGMCPYLCAIPEK